MSKNLFDGSSDSEVEITELKTNREYAKSYNKFREKELLKRLKDRDKNSSESSSDDESDSSDEEIVINKKFDEEFFKALASLKSKNPEIYDKSTEFFQDVGSDDVGNTREERKQKKAMTIKDYERKVILEKDGKYEDEDDSDNETKENVRANSPSYADEQKKLRHEIKKALDSDDDGEEEFGGIFRRREKTKEEKLKEEEEHAVWLAGKKEEISEDVAQALDPLKEYWSSPSLPKQEQFLRDYILNNGYQEKDHDEIPTYDEIVGNFSEDEAELEKQAEFEEKFNFRFEEPDKEFIKRYPRTIESSVRRTDDKRKQKRVEVKERKLREKEQKFKELEMLKEIKRKEILEKIEKLKEVTGNEELPFKEEELDEDFDPEAHDRRMQEIFNEEYYGEDEDEDKPECPDIDELKVEDWDNFDPKQIDAGIDDDYEPHCEDDDFNMDCDYNPETSKRVLQDELIESTKGRRKRKRRNQFMEMIKKEKPVFNPEDEKSYAEYIDEYYKMDCEDMIGDIPCRFKYVETAPNDFGLTIEEILLAKNKELNQWVSLKKAIQIRPQHVELRDRKLYKMKAKNEALKRKIFRSIYGPPSDEEGEEETTAAHSGVAKEDTEDKPPEENNTKKKKKKKKKSKPDPIGEGANKNQREETAGSNQTDRLNGINGKLEKTKEDAVIKAVETYSESATESQIDKKNKKKKKKIKQNGTHNSEESTVQEQQKVTDSRSNRYFGNKSVNNKNPFKNDREPFQGKNKKDENNIYNKMSDERLKAYGINPRKYRKQMQFDSRNQSAKYNCKKKEKFKRKFSGKS